MPTDADEVIRLLARHVAQAGLGCKDCMHWHPGEGCAKGRMEVCVMELEALKRYAEGKDGK